MVTKLMQVKTKELSIKNTEMDDLINAIPNPILIKRNDEILFQNKNMENLKEEIEKKANKLELGNSSCQEVFENFTSG